MDEKLRRLKVLAENDPFIAAVYRTELARLHLIPSDSEVATMYLGDALGDFNGVIKALHIWLHLLQEMGQSTFNYFRRSASPHGACYCAELSHDSNCPYNDPDFVDHINEIEENYRTFAGALDAVRILLQGHYSPGQREWISPQWDLYDLADLLHRCRAYIMPFIQVSNESAYMDNERFHLETVFLDFNSPGKHALVLYFAALPADRTMSMCERFDYSDETALIAWGALPEFHRYNRILRIAIEGSHGVSSDFECKIGWDTGKRRGDASIPFFGNLPRTLQDDPGAWLDWVGR